MSSSIRLEIDCVIKLVFVDFQSVIKVELTQLLAMTSLFSFTFFLFSVVR